MWKPSYVKTGLNIFWRNCFLKENKVTLVHQNPGKKRKPIQPSVVQLSLWHIPSRGCFGSLRETWSTSKRKIQGPYTKYATLSRKNKGKIKCWVFFLMLINVKGPFWNNFIMWLSRKCHKSLTDINNCYLHFVKHLVAHWFCILACLMLFLYPFTFTVNSLCFYIFEERVFISQVR